MVGLINKAALVGAITAAAHAIVGLHLEDIDSLESAAAAGVCVVLAGMTGYGGEVKTHRRRRQGLHAHGAGHDQGTAVGEAATT